MNKHLQEQMRIVPIDWDKILAKNAEGARQQAYDVIKRMNSHFAIFMNGPNIGKIRIERKLRFSEQSIFDTISVAKAKQLFNRKLHLSWAEYGEKKNWSKNVISLWLDGDPSNRKEIYHTPDHTHDHTPVQSGYIPSPLVKWLEYHLNDPLGSSPIRFNSFNPRNVVYATFIEHANESHDWTPKGISVEFYKMMPLTKPNKGHRVRKRGISCIFIPSVEYCLKLLQNWQSDEI